MNRNACKHCGHHDDSPAQKQEDMGQDRIEEGWENTPEEVDLGVVEKHPEAKAKKETKKDHKKDSMVTTKKETHTKKPEFHSEVYSESSSYVLQGGHYKKEVHAEHKIDGKTVFKKDLIDDDGKVKGKELEWDDEGHRHVKPITHGRV